MTNSVNSMTAQKEQLLKLVALKEAHDRLYTNKDFKQIILDGFFVEDCARFARESMNHLSSPEERALSLGMAQAAGYLKRFLQAQYSMASSASTDLHDLGEMELESERAVNE